MNPYVLIAALVGAIGLFLTGISIGVKWEKNDTLAKIAVAQDTAIKGANQAATAEIERTVAAAKTEADARIKASSLRQKGELDAAKKARPECARDDVSMGLLYQSIDAANDHPSTTVKLPDPVRFSTKATDWFGLGRKELGVQDSGANGSLPSAAR